MTNPTPLGREILAGIAESILPYLGYEVTLKDKWVPPPPEPPPPTPIAETAGVFLSRSDLERAKRRMTIAPFDAMYRASEVTAKGLLNTTAKPFRSTDFARLVFAWSSADPPPNSLRAAVNSFTDDSDHMRRLALAFALTGEDRYAKKAIELLERWADSHTPVNLLSHGFDIDYPNANLLGETQKFNSDRPWHLALDTMWQTHGLTNACDAYLLLRKTGAMLMPETVQNIKGWLLRVAMAVNSSFHAWTKWADPRPQSPSYERYRSDNHLSWAHVGLLSAGVALGDQSLIDYVLNGGVWTAYGDGYANPSSVRDVIDRAIESAVGGEQNGGPQFEGRIYEEKIGRSPPIGYAIFHLTAMSLVAQIAKVHLGVDVWSWTGSDGAGIPLALDRYRSFLLGRRVSPSPSETYQDFHRLPWELAHRADVVDASERRWHYQQAIGPVAFLLGKDA